MKSENIRAIIAILFIILLLIADITQYQDNKTDCLSEWWIFVWNSRWSDVCYINWLLVKSY